MVLLATDENNMVYISNPNGLDNTSKSSGWYNINEVTPYIAKALYIESYQPPPKKNLKIINKIAPGIPSIPIKIAVI